MKKVLKLIGFLFLTFLVSIYIFGGGFGSPENLLKIGDKPIIFSHRGVPVNTVENSDEAFIKSKELGFRAIETDIRSTKDGTLVIFHDESCERLLGITGNIQDYSWGEVQNKFLEHEKNTTMNKIKTVKELLNTESYSDILYLDLKKPSIEVADRLLAILDEQNSYKNILIADENIFYLAYLKYHNPKVNTILEGYNKGKEFIHFLIPKNFKPDFYASFLSGVDQDHMEFLKKYDLLNRRIVYGINGENIRTAQEFGLKHIVLDYEDSLGTLDQIESSFME